MSSEGSVSSRVSQFGLYRTIDARTEEFLRLSKKRQIKQGCVCAAISTAVTVTIVIVIILVYEYSVVAAARSTGSKRNWLNLMNSSEDLHERFNSEFTNIDKTTLKLLPILLKALNRNIHVDKIIDETTSFYPPFKARLTTDAIFTKDIFTDPRNWMKMPSSRVYSIEYKTSPIVYFRNPTKNADYYTKIRKIRDYQRIMNYVDKMISDNNSVGSTQPMKPDQTERPLKITTRNKQKLVLKKDALKTTTAKTSLHKGNNNCKCLVKPVELMKKLLTSIQQLLSYVSESNFKKPINHFNYSVENKTSEIQNYVSFPTSPTFSHNYGTFEPEVIRSTPYRPFLNRLKYTVDLSPNHNSDIRRDYTINTITNLLKPNFNKPSRFDINVAFNDVDSTTTNYVKSLENFPVTPIDVATTISDYILQKKHEANYTDYDDYYMETTATVASSFNDGNIDAAGLISSAITPKRTNETVKEISDTFAIEGDTTTQVTYDNTGTMRKFGSLVLKDNSDPLRIFHRFAPISTTTRKTELTTKNITSSTKSVETTSTDRIGKLQNLTTKAITLKTIAFKNDLVDDVMVNSDKIWGKTTSSKKTLQHIQEAIDISFSKENATEAIENFTAILDNTYQWKSIKLEKIATTTMKSMISVGRSTYLEMQRYDWKREENHDYDNYTFD